MWGKGAGDEEPYMSWLGVIHMESQRRIVQLMNFLYFIRSHLISEVETTILFAEPTFPTPPFPPAPLNTLLYWPPFPLLHQILPLRLYVTCLFYPQIMSFSLSSYSYIAQSSYWPSQTSGKSWIYSPSPFFSLTYQQSSKPALHSSKTAFSMYFSNLQITQCTFQPLSSEIAPHHLAWK